MTDRTHRWPWDYCTECETAKPTDDAGVPLVDGELIDRAGWAVWDDSGCVCPDCQASLAVAS